MAYSVNVENLILGVDVPKVLKGFKENENDLKELDRYSAIVVGHIAWELVRSGVLESLSEFDIKIPEYERDSSFGKIMACVGSKSGCTSPDDYEKAFDNGRKTKSFSDEDLMFVCKTFMKIGSAMLHKVKIKIVSE